MHGARSVTEWQNILDSTTFQMPTQSTCMNFCLCTDYLYLLTKLSPQGVVGMCLGQHVHTFRGMFFQKDLDGRLAIWHDGRHPSQVVSKHSCKKSWNKPRVEPMAKYNDQIQHSLEYCFFVHFSFY